MRIRKRLVTLLVLPSLTMLASLLMTGIYDPGAETGACCGAVVLFPVRGAGVFSA